MDAEEACKIVDGWWDTNIDFKDHGLVKDVAFEARRIARTLRQALAEAQEKCERAQPAAALIAVDENNLKAERDALRRKLDAAMKEATIAWSVCASVHREYCWGRDALYTKRQADFVKHETDCRAAAIAALESDPT